jgi:hypothetical protein
MDPVGEPFFRACQRLLLQRYGFHSCMPRASQKAHNRLPVIKILPMAISDAADASIFSRPHPAKS